MTPNWPSSVVRSRKGAPVYGEAEVVTSKATRYFHSPVIRWWQIVLVSRPAVCKKKITVTGMMPFGQKGRCFVSLGILATSLGGEDTRIPPGKNS